MADSITIPQLLTADDVGRLIGRHPRVVLEKARAGEIACIRLGRRGVRFDPADVQTYLDQHRVPDSAYAEIADALIEEANRRLP